MIPKRVVKRAIQKFKDPAILRTEKRHMDSMVRVTGNSGKDVKHDKLHKALKRSDKVNMRPTLKAASKADKRSLVDERDHTMRSLGKEKVENMVDNDKFFDRFRKIRVHNHKPSKRKKR